MKNFILGFSLALFFSSVVVGQSISFIDYSISPTVNGFAGAGAALPVYEGFAVYYNPAQLGAYSQEITAAMATYLTPHKVNPGADLTFYSLALSGGLQFKNAALKSIGAAYWRSSLDYSNPPRIDDAGNVIEESDASSSVNAFSVGGTFSNWVNVYWGLTYKRYSIDVLNNDTGELPGASANANAFDYGLIVEAPFIHPVKSSGGFLNLSVGVAQNNIGGKFDEKYNFDWQNLLPRLLRLGYAISFGYQKIQNDQQFKVLELNLIAEAKDLLIASQDDQLSYEDIWGNLKLYDNLIKLKTTRGVHVLLGGRISFGELLTFGLGKRKYGPDSSRNYLGLAANLQRIIPLVYSGAVNNKYNLRFAFSRLSSYQINYDFWGLEFSYRK